MSKRGTVWVMQMAGACAKLTQARRPCYNERITSASLSGALFV
ncbi:hypothetical protein ARMA_0594 [Ardenticatena maritima]|uniref:Uncharacterized protein n=1 Tax=Ardenticatena maritima TaxID=872965 RepID=A0A0M8K760_9CHLR|nr:hypothetical protein ARMA_0594 [Ardenticatena maritima]